MTVYSKAPPRLPLRLKIQARTLLAFFIALVLTSSCRPSGEQAPEAEDAPGSVQEAPAQTAPDEAGEVADHEADYELEYESEDGAGLESEAPEAEAIPEPVAIEPEPPEPASSEPVPSEPLPPEPLSAESVPPTPDPSAMITRQSERLALETVDVFYGTNRARHADCRSQNTVTRDSTGRCHNEEYYISTARAEEPELEVGQVTISLPPDHETGKIERPTKIFSIQLRKEDPSKDVVLSRLRVYDDYDTWAGAVKTQGKSDAFIYVHGYATSFHAAALRAGQVAADLDFEERGVPMFFSWPSVGSFQSYFDDEKSSAAAPDAFNEFLDLVHTRTGVERVHVIAHSMGNRVVANALAQRKQPASGAPPIDQLILAAPDIDANDFRTRFLHVLPGFAKRVTLYVSDKDRALKASESLRRGKPRAGQRRGGLLAATANRFDPIDATDLDTDFLSHSYYANHISMLSDIYCVLQGAVTPLRPLMESAPAGQGWRFDDLKADQVDVGACGGN